MRKEKREKHKKGMGKVVSQGGLLAWGADCHPLYRVP